MKAFLAAEPAKAAEVQVLRLRNAELQHRIAALEQRLKDSDRLSGVVRCGAPRRRAGGAVPGLPLWFGGLVSWSVGQF